MTPEMHRSPRIFTPDEADARLLGIAKCQELSGHFPSDDALERARRILVGDLNPTEARREILDMYTA